jgi:hypothetical protein
MGTVYILYFLEQLGPMNLIFQCQTPASLLWLVTIPATHIPAIIWLSVIQKKCCKSTPTCSHSKSTRKGHWQWQLFSKGPQPSPKFLPATLYPTHNCIIHSKDTISQLPFSTSPTKYRRCKLLDSSTVA